MGVLGQLSASKLRQKQYDYWLSYVATEEQQMANDEADMGDEALPGETKAERFSRVVNPRLRAAVKRLRLIRQMFEGANANNYEFSVEQHLKLTKALAAEVEAISELMLKRIHGRTKDEVEEI